MAFLDGAIRVAHGARGVVEQPLPRIRWHEAEERAGLRKVIVFLAMVPVLGSTHIGCAPSRTPSAR
ncbi:hypothetical protein [Variovorax sp. OV329]|uniref:hypothetical protein n=1 Tax=Variovorax sp. OV329 TaxID=1882825 RepID=UPI0020C88849|nr:hypothetical protein [Variovorax sp. OV329]